MEAIIPNKNLGYQLLDWHGGMYTGLYAVGSSILAGARVHEDQVKRAVAEIRDKGRSGQHTAYTKKELEERRVLGDRLQAAWRQASLGPTALTDEEKAIMVALREQAPERGEKVRTWHYKPLGLKLEIYDLSERDREGRWMIGYKFFWNGKLVFSGDDIALPLRGQDAIDSIAVVPHVLHWFALKPGDTDDDYFKGYNDLQKEWCDSNECEELSLIVHDMEERHAKPKRKRKARAGR